MIEVKLFVNSNQAFKEFKNYLKEVHLDDTLAIISNDEKQYEFFATESSLIVYKSERNEKGDFETVDEFFGSELINDDVETIEQFVSQITEYIL